MTARQAHIFKSGAKNARTAEEAAERDSWQTPWPLVYALCAYAYGDVRGFVLDVAASEHNAKALVYLSAEDDGLDDELDWVDAVKNGAPQSQIQYPSPWPRIWCNPPWSSITRWLDRFVAEQHSGVVLGPLSDTTVRWSVLHPDIAWRIVGDGRYAFEDPQGVRRPGAGQATLAWFFHPSQRLAPGGGVITDAELAEVAQRVRTVRGLPLFG